jgi:5-methylcytosine-specific restriction protein A
VIVARAPKVCAEPSCTEFVMDGSRCDAHVRRRPHNWNAPRNVERKHRFSMSERRAIISRDRGLCYVCGEFGADEVDHVIPLARGGTDSPTNLKAIHREPCHRDKTSAEAAEGRALVRELNRERAVAESECDSSEGFSDASR